MLVFYWPVIEWDDTEKLHENLSLKLDKQWVLASPVFQIRKFCQIKAVNFPSLKTRQIVARQTASENLTWKWDKH